MKNAPMRFDGMSLSHNPATLHITGAEDVREQCSPVALCNSVSLGRKPVRVSGEGELYGADCLGQYAALENKQRACEVGLLTLPQRRPLYARLSKLELSAEPTDDVIRYSFTFIEAQSPRRQVVPAIGAVSVHKGDTLWDISMRCGASVEKLLQLNPQIRDPLDLTEIGRVRVC